MALPGWSRLARLERALRPPAPPVPRPDPAFEAHARVVVEAFERRGTAHRTYARLVWEYDAREATGEVLNEQEHEARRYFLWYLETHPEPTKEGTPS